MNWTDHLTPGESIRLAELKDYRSANILERKRIVDRAKLRMKRAGLKA